MNDILLYNAGTSPAISFATKELQKMGYTFCNESKNATHLLLNVPTMQQALPEDLPSDITVIGGNLQLPYHVIDLLADPCYIAENAMITAHCAIKVAMREVKHILPDLQILVIGWGRIGKCLARLLQQMGCKVFVAARKPCDRAILTALGYEAIATDHIDTDRFDLIFNTVPVLIIENCASDAIIIELASSPGITGKNVISARGLPGKEAPESSGKLIAKTIHRILSGKENVL